MSTQRLNEYETVCVFIPEIGAEGLKKIDEKIKKIFSQHGVAEVTKKDWGIRRLAYPINNCKTAQYIQLLYTAPGAAVGELERNLGYEESVLRFLTVKHTKRTPKNVQVEPDGFNLDDVGSI